LIFEINHEWLYKSNNSTDDATEKNPSEHNAKAMNSILCRLLEYEFVKVMHCGLTKQIWYKLQNIYEGDGKVKKAKLQTHKMPYWWNNSSKLIIVVLVRRIRFLLVIISFLGVSFIVEGAFDNITIDFRIFFIFLF
jgi:hypothetical protein